MVLVLDVDDAQMMPDSTGIVVQVEAGVTDIFQRQASEENKWQTRKKQEGSQKVKTN